MKLPNFRRIFKQDYKPEDQALVDQLSYTINTGFDPVYEALNNRLTFSENFRSTLVSLNVVVDATGAPRASTTFKLAFTDAVIGVQVLKASNSTNTRTYPTGAPFISFRQSGQVLEILNITGLTAGDTWNITLVALTG